MLYFLVFIFLCVVQNSSKWVLEREELIIDDLNSGLGVYEHFLLRKGTNSDCNENRVAALLERIQKMLGFIPEKAFLFVLRFHLL